MYTCLSSCSVRHTSVYISLPHRFVLAIAKVSLKLSALCWPSIFGVSTDQSTCSVKFCMCYKSYFKVDWVQFNKYAENLCDWLHLVGGKVWKLCVEDHSLTNDISLNVRNLWLLSVRTYKLNFSYGMQYQVYIIHNMM